MTTTNNQTMLKEEKDKCIAKGWTEKKENPYTQGNKTLWSIINNDGNLNYMVADLIDNHFTNHRCYTLLDAALEDNPVKDLTKGESYEVYFPPFKKKVLALYQGCNEPGMRPGRHYFAYITHNDRGEGMHFGFALNADEIEL